MGRENPGGKSSSKYICKLVTQTTYTKCLQIEFFLSKKVAASWFTLIDYLKRKIMYNHLSNNVNDRGIPQSQNIFNLSTDSNNLIRSQILAIYVQAQVWRPYFYSTATCSLKDNICVCWQQSSFTIWLFLSLDDSLVDCEKKVIAEVLKGYLLAYCQDLQKVSHSAKLKRCIAQEDNIYNLHFNYTFPNTQRRIVSAFLHKTSSIIIKPWLSFCLHLFDKTQRLRI